MNHLNETDAKEAMMYLMREMLVEYTIEMFAIGEYEDGTKMHERLGAHDMFASSDPPFDQVLEKYIEFQIADHLLEVDHDEPHIYIDLITNIVNTFIK